MEKALAALNSEWGRKESFLNAKLQISEKATPEKVHVQTNMPCGDSTVFLMVERVYQIHNC